MDPASVFIAAALLAVWASALLVRDRFALPTISPGSIKFTHLLPATLQCILFAYWATYWWPVVEHVPVLALQLAAAYGIDFLLGWTLRRQYGPTLGPVPVVLSANLFVWFGDNFLCYLLVIAVALVSKVFLVARRRHIFNPSVLGLAVFGVLTVVLPAQFRYQDISHDFNRPPYMAHLIVLLALVPQIRLRTAPVALGASVAMLATMLIVYALIGYRGGPSPWWPPWLLAITLLAGDPATIPAATASRLLFGLTLGVLFYVVSRVMLVYPGTDIFSKIIPIPIANSMVPWFDRGAVWLEARWPRLCQEDTNRAYVVAWIALSLFMLIGGARS
ncbi:MAG: hypothetical protein HY270_04330 [Deltaproteobacteria bacterium]|nr:hypothetical protein [Deltaproteobacteria bacterium]